MSAEFTKLMVPAVATLIAVSAALWQYRNSKGEEFRKRFWEEQYVLYSKAANAAATIAMANDLDSAKPSREEFWRLYWGPLSIMEDHEVETAMINFGKKLSDIEKAGRLPPGPAQADTPTELRVAAYQLAHSIRESLARTWHPVDLGKLGRQSKPED